MKSIGVAAAWLVAAAAPAQAASPFDGLWVDDLAAQVVADHADVYELKDGVYACDSCSPPRRYAADGRPHAIAGDGETLSESVRVAGPRRMVTRIVSRQMVRETTMTVSADGKTSTYVSLDRWPNLAAPLRTEFLARRIKPAPPGAHAASGAWQAVRYVAVPVEYRSIRLHDDGATLTRESFRRGRYTAAYGGPPAPISGLPAGGSYAAQVSRPDDLTRVETILADGKPVVERRFELSADGRTLRTTVRDLASGEVFRISAHRAPAN